MNKNIYFAVYVKFTGNGVAKGLAVIFAQIPI
jgi:hypothetical protein